MKLIKLISSTLESLKMPVSYGWYDKDLNTAHITFLEFDNLENEYYDDENESEEHYIQVDLWTKELDDKNIVKSIKQLLKEKNFMYEDGADLVETLNDGSQLYHFVTRWLYEEELNKLIKP